MNFQNQLQVAIKFLDTENTKRVDPIKEALKKWQKEKRLRQIQEKKTKKQPFRLGSNLSHQLSEFKHSYESNENEMNTKKMKINDQSKYAIKPLSQPVKNVSLLKFNIIIFHLIFPPF